MLDVHYAEARRGCIEWKNSRYTRMMQRAKRVIRASSKRGVCVRGASLSYSAKSLKEANKIAGIRRQRVGSARKISYAMRFIGILYTLCITLQPCLQNILQEPFCIGRCITGLRALLLFLHVSHPRDGCSMRATANMLMYFNKPCKCCNGHANWPL